MPLNNQAACLQAINDVPFNEIKYYLLLTYRAVIVKDDVKNEPLLEELKVLSEKLGELLNSEAQISAEKLLQVEQHYQNLRKLSKINGVGTKIGYALINLGSILLALLTGVVGAFAGLSAGVIRSVWELSNPFKNCLHGVVVGFSFGASVGFRAPKKLFKNQFTRQLMFSTNGIAECLEQIKKEAFLNINSYIEQVKADLLSNCFEGNQTALDSFLNDDHEIEIVTFKAQFLSESLEGYLGHHACIKIDIPTSSGSETKLIEFSPSPSNFEKSKVSQKEIRRVTGQKIVEMLALHEQLQVNHPCNLGYQLTKMKPGERDCYSYINMILLGTNQKATTVRRFDGTENWIGTNIIAFFTKKLSPFSQDIFDCEDEEILTSDVSSNKQEGR